MVNERYSVGVDLARVNVAVYLRRRVGHSAALLQLLLVDVAVAVRVADKVFPLGHIALGGDSREGILHAGVGVVVLVFAVLVNALRVCRGHCFCLDNGHFKSGVLFAVCRSCSLVNIGYRFVCKVCDGNALRVGDGVDIKRSHNNGLRLCVVGVRYLCAVRAYLVVYS